MKIKINQTLKSINGKDDMLEKGTALTLKDIVVASLLRPVDDEYQQTPQGAMISKKGDTLNQKLEKWDIFKKVRDAENEVELLASEITIITDIIGNIYPQIIVGQCFEMLENHK
jgi:hypothetical protein